jgi:DNA-binding transcriptional MerR regulator
MTDEISKKDLLELTGISYGQLYRWKRKGLIPEAWFSKRAAFTGQETFFPRAEILERVERIQGLKDDINLDQLAQLLSPKPSELRLGRAELLERNLISGAALDLLGGPPEAGDPLPFDQILLAWLVDQLFQSGAIQPEEGALVLRTLTQAGATPAQGQLLVLRKDATAFCLLTPGPALADPDTRTVACLDLPAQVAKLKLAINGEKQ